MRQRHTDGFVENQVLNRDEAERNEATYRIKFAWDAGNDFDAKLKLEMGSFDVVGRQSEILTDNPSDSDIFLFTGRTYGEILNDTVFPDFGALGNILGSLPAGVRNLIQLQPNGSILNMQADDSVLDVKADRKRSSNGDFSNNDTQNITLNMNWYSNGNTFTSITGFMAYQYDEECDCKTSPARHYSRLYLKKNTSNTAKSFAGYQHREKTSILSPALIFNITNCTFLIRSYCHQHLSLS